MNVFRVIQINRKTQVISTAFHSLEACVHSGRVYPW
jgi:hypothetical protein